jgi:hypothetical protein
MPCVYSLEVEDVHCGHRDNIAAPAIGLAFFRHPAHNAAMRRDFDSDDYALVAKLRAGPPTPWKWEIYCAGKRLPIEQSTTYFESRGAAQAAGKKALTELLARLSV